MPWIRGLFLCLEEKMEKEIIVNGKKEMIKADTVLDFVNSKCLKHDITIVELNEKVIKREDWEKKEIHNGDRMELLSFVGGG